jgi:hypothetical protein
MLAPESFVAFRHSITSPKSTPTTIGRLSRHRDALS